MALEKATFGMGCFWGAEELFTNVEGVVSTTVGYMGGSKENPTYEDVCTDETGHAEVVQVEFDPSKIFYQTLLEIYWGHHDPTTINRQGPDFGTQYRSVVFYHSKEQEETAKKMKEKLDASGKYRRPIVTQILPAAEFYRAEDYHQKYCQKLKLRRL